MSESNEDTGVQQQDEREILMERADDMGISYSKNIKTETLRERVNAKINGTDDSSDDGEDGDAKAVSTEKAETEAQRRSRKRAEATKMVRVRITCMNPNKRNYTGEYFSVGNALIPTMSRFVQFDEPWHVPQMMYQMIKDRKVQVFVKKRIDGRTVPVPKLIPEYSIDVLPDLTEKELKELALQQARREGISDE